MQTVYSFIKGGIIGLANLIPGVSGGTMALILGIYERMINSLNSISLNLFISFIRLFSFKKSARADFLEELKKIDFYFLLAIFVGAGFTIFIFASVIVFLLREYHHPTYGYFFGLILPSLYVPFRMINKRGLAVFLAIFCAASFVIASDCLVSDEEMIQKEELKYELQLEKQNALTENESVISFSISEIALLFAAGAISVSAMILPGVSGSFVLLLMGQYFIVLKAVSDFNIVYLTVFFFGMVFGLLAFTKLLHLLLLRCHDVTMGALTGLVAGSLWIIWPFKRSYIVGKVGVEGYPEQIYLSNMFPQDFGMVEISVIITVILGIATVALMMLIEKKNRIR
ncbi:MAG: DUF368 domain-containing protein [Spirochaetes bacterium]|jgi:putative membrane protein|nr:DUF368 domain-containing protein [Spirochaetota bacterium]